MPTLMIVGCGYLGRRVALPARARGWGVFATTRRPERRAELAGLGCEPVVCDVLDPGSLSSLPPADAVAYCVGLDRGSGRSMREVHVDGLVNVVAAVSRWPSPPRFTHVSSTSVYGQTGGESVDEGAATEPLEENGRVVLAAEQALRARLPGALVLRFAGIYGPHRLIRGRALLAGEPVGGPPDKWLNLIHVDDGAEVVLAALERGRDGGTYNVCDDRPVRRRDFYARLAELLGAPPPRFAEAAQGPQADRRVVNRRLREDLGVALRYPSYEEGLAATVAAERGEEA